MILESDNDCEKMVSKYNEYIDKTNRCASTDFPSDDTNSTSNSIFSQSILARFLLSKSDALRLRNPILIGIFAKKIGTSKILKKTKTNTSSKIFFGRMK